MKIGTISLGTQATQGDWKGGTGDAPGTRRLLSAHLSTDLNHCRTDYTRNGPSTALRALRRAHFFCAAASASASLRAFSAFSMPSRICFIHSVKSSGPVSKRALRLASTRGQTLEK